MLLPFEIGSHWLAWDLLCKPGCPGAHEYPSAGFKGIAAKPGNSSFCSIFPIMLCLLLSSLRFMAPCLTPPLILHFIKQMSSFKPHKDKEMKAEVQKWQGINCKMENRTLLYIIIALVNEQILFRSVSSLGPALEELQSTN